MTFREVLKEKVHHDLGFDFYQKLGRSATFHVITKSKGLLAGVIFIPTLVEIVERELFLKQLKPDPWGEVSVYAHKQDGENMEPGDVIVKLSGDAEVLLKAERTICDIISELSGIATYTKKLVGQLSGESVFLIDTRKEDALWRPMHKYAVRIGGGRNHRAGFYDGKLIKDNDIETCGSVKKAIDRACEDMRFLTKIDVEANSLERLKDILQDGRADIVLLDNMDPRMLRKAVELIRASGKAYGIEASGVGKHDLRAVAKTGVTHISTSALVKKSRDLVDIAMKTVKNDLFKPRARAMLTPLPK